MASSPYPYSNCSSESQSGIHQVLGESRQHFAPPANSYVSMNLDGLYTRMMVGFQPYLPYDQFIINAHELMAAKLDLLL